MRIILPKNEGSKSYFSYDLVRRSQKLDEVKRWIRTQRHQSSAPRPYEPPALVCEFCKQPISLREDGVANQFEDDHELASFRSKLYHDRCLDWYKDGTDNPLWWC